MIRVQKQSDDNRKLSLDLHPPKLVIHLTPDHMIEDLLYHSDLNNITRFNALPPKQQQMPRQMNSKSTREILIVPGRQQTGVF